MTNSSAVAWFEIPVADMARAIRFYNEVLGVELKANPWGDGEIAVFPYTRESGVGGALMTGSGLKPSSQGTVVYLPTSDISAVLDRAAKTGGSVAVPKTAIGPNMGFYARFADSEGNVTGLYSAQ